MQSVARHLVVSHGTTSFITPSHLFPSWAPLVRVRYRCASPTPQVVLQSPQCDQVAKMHGSSLPSQACTLQPTVSVRISGHACPPCCGILEICLCRCCWPTPHFLSQSPYAVQSEISQSTRALPHALTSVRFPSQGSPPILPSVVTFRVRCCCRSLHMLQCVHFDISQGS